MSVAVLGLHDLHGLDRGCGHAGAGFGEERGRVGVWGGLVCAGVRGGWGRGDCGIGGGGSKEGSLLFHVLHE